MSRIGPSLPPHLVNVSENTSSSDEDDAYGPALPPHLLQNQKSSTLVADLVPGPSVVKTSSSDAQDQGKKQIVDGSSSDEEVIGPLPVEKFGKLYGVSSELEKRALKMKQKLLAVDSDVKNEPKREDWMIELPELQNKNFGLGPRTFNRTEKPECTGRDQWTSTPNSKVGVESVLYYFL